MVLAAVAGCGGHVAPTASTFPVKPGTTKEFQSTQRVALINAHSPGESFSVKLGVGEYIGDRKEWADTAIEYLKTELERHGMQVAGGSEKSVKLTIISQRIAQEGKAVRCVVYFRILTGDGYSKVFYGNNIASFYINYVGEALVRRAAEGAIRQVVVAILNDEKVIAYMK